MGCAHTPAGVPVKVFVEVDIVAKLGVLLQLRIEAVYWALAGCILEENRSKAINKLLGHLINGEIVA
jgi:hypothetical protein